MNEVLTKDAHDELLRLAVGPWQFGTRDDRFPTGVHGAVIAELAGLGFAEVVRNPTGTRCLLRATFAGKRYAIEKREQSERRAS